jgi:hypothetical protein
METIMNNPPAFPRPLSVDNFNPDISYPAHVGMSLRDYFAAKAMQGIFASNAEHDHEDEHIFDAVAEAAYKQADAMLKAREA